MNYLKVAHQLLFFIFFIVALASSANSAENLRYYSNQEFGFGFQYPASWLVSTPLTSNSQAKVASLSNTPHAECAVIVQSYPQMSSLSQSEMDQILTVLWPSSEFKNILGQGANDVEIMAVSVGALHFHPAQMARLRFSMGTVYGKAYVSGRMAVTATPGFAWALSCGGQGDTPDEAEKSFLFWQFEINRIVSSFQFE